MEVSAVPGGDFTMGTDSGEAPDWEKSQHTHPSPMPYWIGRSPVTLAQWSAFTAATRSPAPPAACYDDVHDMPAQPVVMVPWNEVHAYCRWAGAVLPSEAESEKAARDGYPWTSPVGAFPQSASAYGALDMAGNVFNWVEDWWDDGFPRITHGDFTPPAGGTWRVDRGSRWGNPGRLANRTTMRYGYPPEERNEHLGFRVLLRAAS